MAFNLQNQEIQELLAALSGGQYGNELLQPALQNIPSGETPEPPPEDIIQQLIEQQALPQPMALQMANQPNVQQQLGENILPDFSGMGLGNTAPQLTQPKTGLSKLLELLQMQGLGGF